MWGDAAVPARPAVTVRAGAAELAIALYAGAALTHCTMNQCLIASLGPKPDVVRA